ncbi:MAG TPA: hypothetical protein VFI65_10745 [Streptosporangiaceae bacterium]|nr:hypothetical protein [Streptosporangiaceae bacterium]
MAAVAALGIAGQPIVAQASATSTCGQANFWAELIGGTVKVYVCGVTTRNLGGPDLYSTLIIRVPNRIWLHQTVSGSTGWADCDEQSGASMSGPVTVGLSGRDMNPGNLQISSNTAFCTGIT